MASADILSLESELQLLHKQRDEVEFRLRGLETKERNQAARAARNAERTPTGIKRGREDRPAPSSRNGRTEVESKKPRLSSVVSTQGEDAQKPKVHSAIVSHTPVAVVGEKPRPSLDASSKEAKSRNKRVFGLVLSTLQGFKTDLNKKSQAALRREELEQKVETKVVQEHENFTEQQKRAIQEEKEKESALREQIKKNQEEKEQLILKFKWEQQRTQLSKFIRTETKPYIYFREAPQKSNTNTQSTATKEEELKDQPPAEVKGSPRGSPLPEEKQTN